ncbi:MULTISPECIES: hypothetical protein [unclassified Rhodococcus (in: high G+C Gram-positive bacteria)]|nr:MULTISPECIES: hypothetical protein [unclassified Rhodococcus (in: high G+C Gram-positive bacteria)]MBF0661929.1 hypothetical protein [Rhodococcus sp. (in: high G+C Gram-positive bacteria)]NMD94896.1 hypothetical protein [Rhodococcus sp. BL-253-APC-6A1W]NME80947.1 hypothetical protein [Rhodococcus sp. 105337]
MNSTEGPADRYDPSQDPDADPENLRSGAPLQPDQAEGEDDPEETDPE